MNIRPNWKALSTAGKIDAIREFWFSGCSTAQIAANLEGATRNAVIGMYHRFPNSLTDKPLVSRGIADDVAAKARKDRRRSNAFLSVFEAKESKPLAAPPVIAEESILCGKPMMMLGPKECRWAINSAERDELHLFCGQ